MRHIQPLFHTIARWLLAGLFYLLFPMPPLYAGEVETFTLQSEVLQGTLVGVNPEREIRVYLPDGYQRGRQRYPVMYYLHNAWWDNIRLFGDESGLKSLLDLGIKNGEIPPMIVVAGDFRTPRIGCFFGNNPVNGRWRDHIHDELMPEVDRRYRTQASASQRVIAGDFFGGYGALRMVMEYPGAFDSVYSMHPVATDSGERSILALPDWRLMNTAQSWEELDVDVINAIFMLMAQSFTPNPNTPPFYADLMVELIDDELVINADHVKRLRANFLLRERLPDTAHALRNMKYIKLDWGRNDNNPDHVEGNQKFTRMLNTYGVDHEAEEFDGGPFDRYWGEDGRVRTELFPFLRRAFLDGE